MFSVGFAKSCCSTWSAFWGVTLLLSGGAVEAAPPGSALPVSGIKTVVTVPHQGNTRREGVESIVAAQLRAYHGNCILVRLAHRPGNAGNDVVFMFLQTHGRVSYIAMSVVTEQVMASLKAFSSSRIEHDYFDLVDTTSWQ
jgi:hypothetical protein